MECPVIGDNVFARASGLITILSFLVRFEFQDFVLRVRAVNERSIDNASIPSTFMKSCETSHMEHSRTSRELYDKASQTIVPWCSVLRKYESTGNHKFEFDIRGQMECPSLSNIDDRCFSNEDNSFQQFL
jgi:hypothetical protein